MRTPLIVLLASLLQAAAPDFDVLITNGRIVDGTGNPSFIGDVGIVDGRIAAVGALAGKTATRTLRADGLVVAPGFVDIHNHSDDTILIDGDAQSMVRQGVTSMIFGEGGSKAPSEEFPTFETYFAEVLKSGVSTNIGSYIGSSQLWMQVVGPQNGPPTSEQLARMEALVREDMEDGALGVASSLTGPPGVWIDTDTLVALSSAVAPYGGIYSTHNRNEGLAVFEAVAEAIDIGRRAGVPVDIIHLKISEHSLWGSMPKLIDLIADARARGQQVEAHVYPYRAGQNNLRSIIPPWAQEGGTERMFERFKDPGDRARIEREIRGGIPGWYNHFTATGTPEGMQLTVVSNPELRKFEGMRLSEVAAALQMEAVDAIFYLLEENDGSVPTVYFHHDEQDMLYAMRQPFVSLGSDGRAIATSGPLRQGHPHPRYYGTFPRILGRYVRDQQVITMEEAIRKMTSANAAKVHIYDRGILRPGQWADVVVFDPATIIDHATFEDPHQYSTGVAYLLVNGTMVLEGEQHTGARPGVVLYGPGKN